MLLGCLGTGAGQGAVAHALTTVVESDALGKRATGSIRLHLVVSLELGSTPLLCFSLWLLRL